MRKELFTASPVQGVSWSIFSTGAPRINPSKQALTTMILYARLVPLFRLFQQTVWRNLRTLSTFVCFARRAFPFLWRQKGDPNRRRRARKPLNINLKGSDQPTVFAASQDPAPRADVIPQGFTTSSVVETSTPVAFPLHSSEESHGVSTHDCSTGYDAGSSRVYVGPSVHSSLNPNPEDPPTFDGAGIGTLALSAIYPAFRPIVPTDMKRRDSRHGGVK